MKRSLESWREAVLFIDDLLLWKRSWHAGALLSASTILFTLIWLFEPSVLTTFSLLALFVCLVDYCGPSLCQIVFSRLKSGDEWTAQNERRLDELCRTLVLQYTHTATSLASFWLMRVVRPRIFYIVTGSVLVALAWIGSVINNLLLTYILFTGIILMPGLRARGIFTPYAHKLSDIFMQLLVQHNKTE